MYKNVLYPPPIKKQAIMLWLVIALEYILQVLPFKLNNLGLVMEIMLCNSSSLASKVVTVSADILLSCENCLHL